MTIHRLDEVLEARQQPRRPAPEPVSSVRLIPRPCSCTWRLNLGAIEATWTLTQTDPYCPMHGEVRT
jgi:hypothetical protein